MHTVSLETTLRYILYLRDIGYLKIQKTNLRILSATTEGLG